MSDFRIEKACPRLIDYLCVVGNREAGMRTGQKVSSLVLKPQLLKKFPPDDYKDFPLPTNVVSFCQPEGCIVLNAKKVGKKETTFFIFTLTDKDSGLTRYGICLNFYRHFEALRTEGRPTTESYQLLSGEDCGAHNKLTIVKTSSDSAFSSDPRKVHSEEESDCETLAEPPNYFSGDLESRGKSSRSTRGKRRTKSSGSSHPKRRQKSLTQSTMSTSTNSSSRTITRGGENGDRCFESRSDPELSDNELVPSRIRKSGLRNKKKGKLKPLRYYSLTSLCFLSHYPFVSNFRECLTVLRQLVDGIQVDISSARKSGGSAGCPTHSGSGPDRHVQHLLSSWDLFIDGTSGCSTCDGPETPPSRSRPPTSSSSSSSTARGKPSRLAFHKIKEVETWIANLLASPVPTPGLTRVELTLLPLKQIANPPLIFALPDYTRFSLCDFPLHLPLELLGVNKCLQVLSLVLLERKIVMQSHDYSALTFSILSLTKMIYPLEYVFPVIPLLPMSMNGSEQLLLAPTPYIIGVPSNFLSSKRNFKFPEDVWLVDLDSANIKPQSSSTNLEVPSLPEPDIKVLKNHLKQVLGGMSIQPIKNFDELPAESLTKMAESIEKLAPPMGGKAFYPFIFGNDVDSVDIATRVAMVRFFNSSNLLSNFSDHTRTLRLLPRPIVAIQVQSLLKSRSKITPFMKQFTSTQAVEFYAEWSLTPTNIAFHRVHNSIFDPVLIGDKPKWYAHSLKCIQYFVWSENKKFSALMGGLNDREELATDESGSDTDFGSTSSCSSYSDLVSDFQAAEVEMEQCQVEEFEAEEECQEMTTEETDYNGMNEFVSQQSYEDNEEIMGFNENQATPPNEFEPIEDAQCDEYFQSEPVVLTQIRAAKPPTPIPKSFSMTDSEDEDCYNNPFQFCTKKPNLRNESESDGETKAEEKASDEMAMELFSSIAKLTMNAQLSVCDNSEFDFSDSVDEMNGKNSINRFEPSPPTNEIHRSSIQSQGMIHPPNFQTWEKPIFNKVEEIDPPQPQPPAFQPRQLPNRQPFYQHHQRIGPQKSNPLIQSSINQQIKTLESILPEPETVIPPPPPYVPQHITSFQHQSQLQNSTFSLPKNDNGSHQSIRQDSTQSYKQTPPPLPPRPKILQQLSSRMSNNSQPSVDKSDVQILPSQKSTEMPSVKLKESLTEKQVEVPSDRPSEKPIERQSEKPNERQSEKPNERVSFSEEARQKKLDFFRALGQATLEEIDATSQKSQQEKTSKLTEPTFILDDSIVTLSSYNRQISAPNQTLSNSLQPLTAGSNCSRQMSVPASWKEDIRQKQTENVDIEVASIQPKDDTTAIDPECASGNGVSMTRSASSMSNASNFSFATQQLWSSISSDLSGLATQTSNLLGGFLSGSRTSLHGNGEEPVPTPTPGTPKKINKSFREKEMRPMSVTKGNKFENKSFRRTITSSNDQNLNRRSLKKKTSSGNAEAHLLIQDIIDRVLQGEGIGWLRFNRLKKLMEEESNRTFALNYFSRNIKSRVSKNGHVQDFCLDRSVWKGVLRLATAVIHGLELAVTTATVGGMASAFHLLEIAHTHYWKREIYRKPSVSSLAPSPFGSQETLLQPLTNNLRGHLGSVMDDDSIRDGGVFTDASYNEDESDLEWQSKDPIISRKGSQSDFLDGMESDTQSIAGSETGSFTTNIGLLNTANIVNNDQLDEKYLGSKTGLSQGNRFRHGKLQRTVSIGSIANNFEKVYLFEGLVKAVSWGAGDSTPRRGSMALSQMSSSFVWEDANFWEDLFYDTISRERELIGMDSNIKNLLDRYKTLPENEKRLLEHDEDRLLATILYNMAGYMLMMQVNKTVIRKKIQRLLGKCHIGLNYSQELNRLIDDLPLLEANDIDLKPVPSRQMCRKTFIVHSGKDASSSVAFIEVRENGLIIRSVNGAVTDRWLFEELVNMTYSPKNKVLCLWRRSEGLTEMQKYYTKKCKNLYYCIKEAMESTLVPTSAPLEHGPELGGEFPIEELHTGEGGLLKVCMEGVRLLFAQRKLFIRLDHIKKCFTQKGGIFVLEEFNPKTRQLLHRYYTSSMADQICYSILCVFSYLAVGQNKRLAAQQQSAMNDEEQN